MEKLRKLSQAEISKGYKRRNEKIEELKELDPSDEIWINDIYEVDVIKGMESGLEMDGKPVIMTHLSIKRRDKRALVDWRHFQWIKNEIIGPENEGIEIYPAESRLVDAANQYHIWVFEDPTFRLPIGFPERLVTERTPFGETQRKFPLARKPNDLEENEYKMQKYIE